MIIKSDIPIGKQLKSIRREHQIKQNNLALMVGSDSPHISRLESGKLIPNINTVLKYAKALGYDNIEIDIVDENKRKPSFNVSRATKEEEEISKEAFYIDKNSKFNRIRKKIVKEEDSDEYDINKKTKSKMKNLLNEM